ncbi:hypothetical protein RJ639_031589 [Escallonia herrerae]|uniref:Reverse transcriptase Ty1/copia-type domain-containing protein n=1 Tax=Escallonia herrerae TaxID=1293975 RepID=A0AA88X7M8_9ASTE|nr:hypothetical protein RJ639_031589 [Escallonia herrerae]
MLANGYVANGGDTCIFSKFRADSGVLICLYVDDMFIFGTKFYKINEVKNFLASNFSMKDLGEADVILGIKIIRSQHGIVHTQSRWDGFLLNMGIESSEKFRLNTIAATAVSSSPPPPPPPD